MIPTRGDEELPQSSRHAARALPAAVVGLAAAIAYACAGPLLASDAVQAGGDAARERKPDLASAVYVRDRKSATHALQVVTAHTLARPVRAKRLFVEGYFMRSLVAAQAALGDADAVLAGAPGQPADSLDVRRGVDMAIAFADSLVTRQDKFGYWPIGYPAVFIADMASAVELFAAIEPFVDDERKQKYALAAQRFVTALEEDAMFLPSGALGVGWVRTVLPRSKTRVSREPYLVSTALAGVAVQSWLFRRTGEPRYRERALHALEYTLAQLQPDGALTLNPAVAAAMRSPGVPPEAQLAVTAYVQEGWMAADVYLEDPEVLARLRT